MGGGSYSYVCYENGYGVFNGTAVSEAGGFSNTGTIDFSENSWYGDRGSFESQNWKDYDGVVVDVAS